MPVTIANKSSYATSADVGSINEFVWNHEVVSGDNRILVVFVSGEEAATPPPAWASVTYGGVALTKAVTGQADEGFSVGIEIWYLLNPAVGTAQIAATGVSGRTMSHGAACAYTLTGAVQAAPEATSQASTVSDVTTLGGSITTTTDGALILSGGVSNIEATLVSSVGTVEYSLVGSPGSTGGGSRSTFNALTKSPAGAQAYTYTSGSAFGRCALAFAAFAPAETVAVTLNDYDDGRIVQRSALTTGTVALSGTLTGGAISAVEARIMQGATQVAGWTALTIEGGAYSGALTDVPVGDGYGFEVRAKNSGDEVVATAAGTHSWGIGAIILCLGSSTIERLFTDATEESSNSLARKFTSGWAANTGSGARALANAIIGYQPDVPVGLIDAGVGGTYLYDWADQDANYLAAVAKAEAAGGVVEAVLVHIGSNDARDGTVTQPGHLQNWRDLIDALRAAVPAAAYLSHLPVLISACQRSPDEPSGDDGNWTAARAAEQIVATDTAVHIGADVIDLEMDGDDIHLSAASMAILGRRCATSYSVNILGQSRAYQGPVLTGADYNGATGKIVVTAELNGGTQLVGRTAQTGITGFRVSTDNFATLRTIEATEIISPTEVELTVATGLSNVRVDYLTGADPDVSNCLFNNAPAP